MALISGGAIAKLLHGYWQGSTTGAAPGEPTITAVVAGNTQVTITVDGDAGVTNGFYYRVSGDSAWTVGLTRSGDGNIVQTGLTNGTTYEGIVVSTSGGEFSLPSACVRFTPLAAADAPNAPIPAYINAMFNNYINSTNFLAWINSVDAGETTSGHVFLEWNPKDLPNIRTKGPVALIAAGGVNLANTGGPFTFSGELDIMVDHVWSVGANIYGADTFINEWNYIDPIMNEMIGDIGKALDATYGGTLSNIRVDDTASGRDEHDNTLEHLVIVYTIKIGKDG